MSIAGPYSHQNPGMSFKFAGMLVLVAVLGSHRATALEACRMFHLMMASSELS